VDDTKLEQVLQDHLGQQNPNPERVGCPTEEELRTLVFHPHQVDRTTNEHLTTCSECFGLYRSMVHDRRRDRSA
jgi:hypothetical protein